MGGGEVGGEMEARVISPEVGGSSPASSIPPIWRGDANTQSSTYEPPGLSPVAPRKEKGESEREGEPQVPPGLPNAEL
jgi:hypothetical protein